MDDIRLFIGSIILAFAIGMVTNHVTNVDLSHQVHAQTAREKTEVGFDEIDKFSSEIHDVVDKYIDSQRLPPTIVAGQLEFIATVLTYDVIEDSR